MLFEPDSPDRAADAFDPGLSQWMTPSWAAEAIVALALDGLPDGSTVVEPSCGTGMMLGAISGRHNALGVEIDARLAELARNGTGRTVVEGDFRTVALPIGRVDAFIGNPPFRMDVLEGMLSRMHDMLDDGGTATLLLPAFAFQTSSRVVRWNARWSLAQQMLPRTIFPGLRLPLVMATFTKDAAPSLSGFLLYHESREVEEMPALYRRALSEGRSGWRAVVEAALKRLGGEATVAQICHEIAPRRPTATRHWREKVRQQLSTHFTRTGEARYALAG